MQRNGADVRSCGSYNAFARYALVNRHVVVDGHPVVHNRAVEDLVDLVPLQAVVVQVTVAKIAPGNEMMVPGAVPIAPAVFTEAQPEAHTEGHARSQRGPTAVSVSVTPAHPGRSPHGIRRPAPAKACVPKPAPVMKR